jgi:hypothetical protein
MKICIEPSHHIEMKRSCGRQTDNYSRYSDLMSFDISKLSKLTSAFSQIRLSTTAPIELPNLLTGRTPARSIYDL